MSVCFFMILRFVRVCYKVLFGFVSVFTFFLHSYLGGLLMNIFAFEVRERNP